MRKKEVANLDEKGIYEISHFAVNDWLTNTLNNIGQPLDRHRKATIRKKMNEDHFLSLMTFKTLNKFNYTTEDRLFNEKMSKQIKNIMGTLLTKDD